MSPLEGDKKEFVDIQTIALLESDEEELKERKGLKILIPDKLLTRLLILLTQINTGNNSYKLDIKIRQ